MEIVLVFDTESNGLQTKNFLGAFPNIYIAGKFMDWHRNKYGSKAFTIHYELDVNLKEIK